MTLSADERRTLGEALARMRLIASGEVPTLTMLTGGVSSLIVRADTACGPVCVKRALPQLKVAAAWTAPVERNRAEVAWMKIAMRVVPGAVPDILGEDEPTFTFAMTFLDPRSYPVWKDQLRDGIVERAIARSVAEMLVAIHRGTAGDDAVARIFANDASFYALRLDPYFATIAAVHPECAARLERLIQLTARTKHALVHGDVSPKNILVGPAGPVLLDAECAWYGDPAFDLAFCLNHLLLKCLWRPQSAVGFLDCFDTFAQTYLAGVTWEPVAEIEARAAALLPAMLLARIDGKSPVEYVTQERDRERVRRFAIPLVIEPVSQLAIIRNTWKTELKS